MPVATHWSIVDMTRTTADDVVYEIKWQCLAQNDSGPEYAVEAGEIRTTADPNDPNFVPFDQLDEATVLGWVWDDESVDKDAIALRLVEKVDARIARNNSTASGLPWA